MIGQDHMTYLQFIFYNTAVLLVLAVKHYVYVTNVKRKPKKAGNLKMTFSCQPDHCSAYANDLCWRMVRQREALGYSYDKIASPLFGEQYSCFSQQAMLLKGLILRKEHTEY